MKLVSIKIMYVKFKYTLSEKMRSSSYNFNLLSVTCLFFTLSQTWGPGSPRSSDSWVESESSLISVEQAAAWLCRAVG